MELPRDIRCDRVVDGNECNRLAGLLAAPQAKGRNVDPVLAEPRAKRADETRLVGVDDVDHLAGELRLDRYPEDVDEARRAVAEQGAFNALFPMLRADGDGDERMIVTFPLVSDFAHRNAAFLREI